MQDPKGVSTLQKISLQEESRPALKLVLSDEPFTEEKKQASEPPKIPIQKRILIAPK
jgi:hypothetical protein